MIKQRISDWIEAWKLIVFTLILLLLFAFIADSPAKIFKGLIRIYTSHTMLGTDYIAIGGLGASLVNAALTGFLSLLMLRHVDAKMNGPLMMAVLMTIGFSFAGKNLVNMLPVMIGVWLYSRYVRDPFRSYSLIALLATTLSPVVTTTFFLNLVNHPILDIILGIFFGLIVGFFVPVIASSTNRVHGGYNLYNMGFAGGIIALFLIALMDSFNIKVLREAAVSSGNNVILAVLLYLVFTLWIISGLICVPFKKNLENYRRILSSSGRLVTDYFLLYKQTAFINMGIMGIIGTTLVLLLKAQINGPTLAGLFTIMGFAAFGKHPVNCVPVMSGAVIFAYINHLPPNEPSNIVPILFCTGLAPIAGQYGWQWGLLSGVLHLIIVGRVGLLGGGLNLYNNGFAAGFVVLFLMPIIMAFRRRKDKK